jgi:hypothetical protein
MATFVAPATIAFDGTGHVANSINSWLAGLPDGATARLRPGGHYQVGSAPITLTDRHDITFDGNGATISTDADYAGSLRPFIQVVGGTNVQVKNFILQGRLTFLGPYTGSYASPDEWQAGVEIDGHIGTGRATVLNCTINNVYGDAVTIKGDERNGLPYAPSQNIIVHGGTFTGMGRMGVAVTNAANVTIEDVTINNSNWSLIDLEAFDSSESLDGVTLQRITGGPLRHHFVAAAGSAPNVGNITIRDCVMTAQSQTCLEPIYSVAPSGTRRANLTVTRNTFLCYQSAGELQRWDNVIWTYNSASSTGGNGGCGQDWHLQLTGIVGAYLTGNKYTNVSTLQTSTNTTNLTIAATRWLGTEAWTGTQAWVHPPAGATSSSSAVAAGVGSATVTGRATHPFTATATGTGGAAVTAASPLVGADSATGVGASTVTGRVTHFSGALTAAGAGTAGVVGSSGGTAVPHTAVQATVVFNGICAATLLTVQPSLVSLTSAGISTAALAATGVSNSTLLTVQPSLASLTSAGISTAVLASGGVSNSTLLVVPPGDAAVQTT